MEVKFSRLISSKRVEPVTFNVLIEHPRIISYGGGPWYDKGLCDPCKRKNKLLEVTREPEEETRYDTHDVILCRNCGVHLPWTDKHRREALKSLKLPKRGRMELINWVKTVVSVEGNGQDKDKVENALLNLDDYNVRLHWWLIRKHLELDAKRIKSAPVVKVKVDRKPKLPEQLYCRAHYEAGTGVTEVSICDDYMISDPVAILGAIHFEAHNARNGSRFRCLKEWRDLQKPKDTFVTAPEYAGWTCAIELDTFFGWSREAIFICMNEGYIGPQEWRNLMAIGPVEYGCRDQTWLNPGYDYSADALCAFSFSAHNPNLADLSETTFISYVPGKYKDLDYNKFIQDLIVFKRELTYKKAPAWRRNELIAWLKKDNIKGWFDPEKERKDSKNPSVRLYTYCQVIAAILAEQNDRDTVEWMKRCRVPDDLYRICMRGLPKPFAAKEGGKLKEIHVMSTISKEEFKARHQLSILDGFYRPKGG